MVAKLPSMPVFTDALLGDTEDLSAEEFGAYCRILFVTWRNNGAPLEADDIRLARIAKVTPRRWKAMRPVLERFFDLTDGRWRQKCNHFDDGSGTRLPWRQWAMVRTEVFDRDGRVCVYCGSSQLLECDHVVPVSMGGTNHPSNLVTACKTCNRTKGNKMPEEWHRGPRLA